MGHGEGIPSALGDQLALPLGDHCHDADHGLVGGWQVGSDELHSAVAEMQQERGAGLQEFGNRRRRAR